MNANGIERERKRENLRMYTMCDHGVCLSLCYVFKSKKIMSYAVLPLAFLIVRIWEQTIFECDDLNQSATIHLRIYFACLYFVVIVIIKVTKKNLLWECSDIFFLIRFLSQFVNIKFLIYFKHIIEFFFFVCFDIVESNGIWTFTYIAQCTETSCVKCIILTICYKWIVTQSKMLTYQNANRVQQRNAW